MRSFIPTDNLAISRLKRHVALLTANIEDNLYLVVAIAVLILLGLNLMIVWKTQFYFNEPVINILSFRPNDPSWIPSGTSFGPALGVHYFGDFELYMGYARTHIAPYGPTIGLTPLYGPLAIVAVKILNVIAGWPDSVFVYLLTSLALFVCGIIYLLGRTLVVSILAIMLIFTGPMILALDRGNLEIIVATLVLLFCIGVLRDRPVLTVVSMIAAASISIYALLLVLVLIKDRRWQLTLISFVGTIATYLISFAVLGGDLWYSVRSFLHTNLVNSAVSSISSSKDFVLGSVSAAGLVYKTLFLQWGAIRTVKFLDHVQTWQILLPGVLIGIACLIVIAVSRQREVILVATLAMIQLVPTGNSPVVQIDMVIELCILLQCLNFPRQQTGAVGTDHPMPIPNVLKKSWFVACSVLLTIGVVPSVVVIYGTEVGTSTPFFSYLGPVVNVCVVGILLVGTLLSLRSRNRQLSTSMV